MAHWKSGFPSRYLQVSDLDRPIVATIAGVKMENVGSGENAEMKPVVRFKESNVKSCVLNLTRAEAIETIAGDPDMDKWPDTKIKLTKGSTRYQGKKVACISIAAVDDIDATMQSAETF